jgi:iron complex outermembrane receptor protein
MLLQLLFMDLASNGVIIITPKGGKAGEMQVSYSGSLQVSEITKQVDALSTSQFKDFINANGTAAQKSFGWYYYY